MFQERDAIETAAARNWVYERFGVDETPRVLKTVTKDGDFIDLWRDLFNLVFFAEGGMQEKMGERLRKHCISPAVMGEAFGAHYILSKKEQPNPNPTARNIILVVQTHNPSRNAGEIELSIRVLQKMTWLPEFE